jgi:hypothetical protein
MVEELSPLPEPVTGIERVRDNTVSLGGNSIADSPGAGKAAGIESASRYGDTISISR